MLFMKLKTYCMAYGYVGVRIQHNNRPIAGNNNLANVSFIPLFLIYLIPDDTSKPPLFLSTILNYSAVQYVCRECLIKNSLKKLFPSHITSWKQSMLEPVCAMGLYLLHLKLLLRLELHKEKIRRKM